MKTFNGLVCLGKKIFCKINASKHFKGQTHMNNSLPKIVRKARDQSMDTTIIYITTILQNNLTKIFISLVEFKNRDSKSELNEFKKIVNCYNFIIVHVIYQIFYLHISHLSMPISNFNTDPYAKI